MAKNNARLQGGVFQRQLRFLVKGSPEAIDPSSRQVEFSPNAVLFDNSGPNLPNKSIVFDTRGVVNVSELSEDAYLADLGTDLVEGPICAEDCINLLALPMIDDPLNSNVSRLVREVSAESRMTSNFTKVRA
ncbi:hypothetical protein ACLMJK_008522 [Lecanora helva]